MKRLVFLAIIAAAFAGLERAQVSSIPAAAGGGGSGNATTINGGSVPLSAACLGSNGSGQPINGTCGAALASTSLTMSGNAVNFTGKLPSTYGTYSITLTANLTTFTALSGWVDGALYTFIFTQNATGGWTVTYPGVFTPAPAQPIPDASTSTTVQCVYSSTAAACVPVGTTATHGMAATSSAPSGTPPAGQVFTWIDSTTNVLTTKDSTGTTHSGGSSSTQSIRTVSSGTTDTIVNGDCGNIVVITSTSNLTETWPQAGSTGFGSGCRVTYTNANTLASGEMVSHTTSTSNFTNMGGSAAYYWTPPAITEVFISDGTNWEIQTQWPKTLFVYAQNSFCASSDGAVYATLGDASSITCNNTGTTQTFLLNNGTNGNSPFAFPANFFNSVSSRVRIDLDMYQTGTGNINSDFRINLNNSAATGSNYAYRANNAHWNTGTNLAGSYSYFMGTYASPGSAVVFAPMSAGGSANGSGLMTVGAPQSNTFATTGALPLNVSWSFASTTATNAVMLRRIAVTWLSF